MPGNGTCFGMRLNVYLARAAGLSRREADQCIKQGKVSLNGAIARQPFLRVKVSDEVAFEGRVLTVQRKRYFIFHKPKGVTTTRKDPFADRIVADFFPKHLAQLFPVGRLDKNSSGLLIMTNDGALCYQLTHPKFSIEKEYRVTVKGVLKKSDCQRAQDGVYDRGQRLSVKAITLLKRKRGVSVCKVIVCEGKKRHIRRLFRRLGFVVEELVRVRIATLRLGRLQPGRYRELNRDALYAKVLFELKKSKTMVV